MVSSGPPQERREDTLTKQNRVVISFRGDWDGVDIDIPGINNIKNDIVAPYPEEGIDMQLSSSWENDFQNVAESVGAESITQKLGGSSVQGVMSRLFGKSNLYTWKGIDPVEISMNLQFVTHSDPLYDVIQPAFQLGSTQMPNALGESSDGIVVKRPVEASEDTTRYLSVHVGTWLSFPAVLPTNASPTFSGSLTTSPSNLKKSFPFQAEVDFQFIGSVFPQKGDFGFDLNTSESFESGSSSSVPDRDSIDATVPG